MPDLARLADGRDATAECDGAEGGAGAGRDFTAEDTKPLASDAVRASRAATTGRAMVATRAWAAAGGWGRVRAGGALCAGRLRRGRGALPKRAHIYTLVGEPGAAITQVRRCIFFLCV